MTNRTTLTKRVEVRIALALKAVANAILRSLRAAAFPFAQPQSPRRVCIYRIGNLGDVVCSLPAMFAIRRKWPNAHLTVVSSPGRRGMPGAAELLAGVGWIDELVIYHADELAGIRAKLKWLRRLRERNFDAWVELPAVAAKLRTLARNVVVARLANARWAAGWRYERLRIFARAQSDLIDLPDEVERLLELVQAAGFPSVDSTPLELSARERRAVDLLLAHNRVEAGTRLAALAPGAKAAPNRWPLERFEKVGRDLAARGYRVAILGAAAEAAECRELAASIGQAAFSVAGSSSVRESSELLRRAQLLVCVDSGVQHLAAAVGTPCVSIFSSRDFRGRWHPHGPEHTVLREHVSCHTCFVDTCPFENRCMRLVSANEVIAATACYTSHDSRPVEVRVA